jgi:hypothetical protein
MTIDVFNDNGTVLVQIKNAPSGTDKRIADAMCDGVVKGLQEFLIPQPDDSAERLDSIKESIKNCETAKQIAPVNTAAAEDESARDEIPADDESAEDESARDEIPADDESAEDESARDEIPADDESAEDDDDDDFFDDCFA